MQFEVPAKMKTWSLALIAVGLVALVTGLVTKGFSADEHEQTQFWGTLMYNSIFWTLVCNAAMFFIGVTTMAMGGFQQSFRRVPEAISTMVPIFGAITFAVLMYVIFGHKHHIYHWLDTEAVANDPILKGKAGFLNPVFFVIWTTLTIALWSLFGWRIRKLNEQADGEQQSCDIQIARRCPRRGQLDDEFRIRLHVLRQEPPEVAPLERDGIDVGEAFAGDEALRLLEQHFEYDRAALGPHGQREAADRHLVRERHLLDTRRDRRIDGHATGARDKGVW